MIPRNKKFKKNKCDVLLVISHLSPDPHSEKEDQIKLHKKSLTIMSLHPAFISSLSQGMILGKVGSGSALLPE